MKRFIVVLGVTLISVQAHGQCATESALRELDAGFEHALEKNDLSYFEKELAPNFVWVHDHAGMVQRSRMEVIEFLRNVNGSASQERTQTDVRVIMSSGTGVVYGFTDVIRGGQKLTFHFMRTYAAIGGKCVLMANHTMEIPQG